MDIKIFLYLGVFGGIFFLAYLVYPYTEKILTAWQVKKVKKITPRLDKMFIDVSSKKLMLIDALSPVVSGFAGYFVTGNWVVTLACAVFGLVIPVFVVKRLEISRRKKFSGQLVDGLMLLSSSLKAGLSLPQSFSALVEEMPAPISQEFSLVNRQMQMGVPLDEAMYTLKNRMKVDELDMVVTAIMVARETGGNLTEIFSQVATTIQERNKLIGRVNALCVQGKMQGAIMSILPIFFGAFVYKVNPEFFDIFLKESFGRMLLGYAAVSQLLGIFFIRKFSKIDI